MKKQAKKSPAQRRKDGVIATIASLIEKARKPKGITKEQIVNELARKFPKHRKPALKNTVNIQVPGRISRERHLKIQKSDVGGFYTK